MTTLKNCPSIFCFRRFLCGQGLIKTHQWGLFVSGWVVKGSPLTYPYGFFGHNTLGFNHGSLFFRQC